MSSVLHLPYPHPQGNIHFEVTHLINSLSPLSLLSMLLNSGDSTVPPQQLAHAGITSTKLICALSGTKQRKQWENTKPYRMLQHFQKLPQCLWQHHQFPPIREKYFLHTEKIQPPPTQSSRGSFPSQRMGKS